MYHRAFVLIETRVGKSKAALAKISQLEKVISADSVTGTYDVIAIVESESLNEVGKTIIDKIQTIAGVSRTVTCIVVPYS